VRTYTHAFEFMKKMPSHEQNPTCQSKTKLLQVYSYSSPTNIMQLFKSVSITKPSRRSRMKDHIIYGFNV